MASQKQNVLPVSEGLISHDASSTDLPRSVRQNWDDAFQRMAEFKDDLLFDDVYCRTSFDQKEWEW